MSLNNRISLSITLFLVLCLLLCSTTAKQVDSFNLLLPTSYHAIKGHARQIVITSGECYDWQSTDANIIKVQGTHHGLVPSQTASKSSSCNSNGIVELVHQGVYPSSVYITARDRLSSQLISIPVRIRDLKRISIVTKSKIMNIREIQNLQIRGFDSENNTFTSIEGLRFAWTITEISDESHSKGSIQKIPLRESSLYMPLDTRKKLQIEEGAESDLLIIRANQVGKVSVKARCIESNYELISDQIILYIQQKFELSPGLPIHLLAGSTFQYNLLTPSGLNKTLPQSFYKIELSNPNFQSSPTLLVKTPRSSEESTLTVLDTRTSPAFSQSATIYSHQPDSIEILMAQSIIVGETIRYDIKFYHNQKLLKGSIDPSLLNIAISELPHSNGDRVFLLDRTTQKIQGFNKGSGIFKVEYNGLKAEKPIKSITPLKLVSQSPRVVLPVGQIYQLNIVGGSGLYKYSLPTSSNEHELISVAFNGLITTKKQGSAIIVVTDQKNAHNRLEIKILILRFGDIQSIQKYKEFNLNEEGSLFIAGSPRVYSEPSGAKTIQHFTECNDALLRGLNLSPLSSSGKVLEIININPVNYQTLNQLLAYSQTNKNINKLLQSRTTIIKEDILSEFKIYLKAAQLKESQLQRMILDMENYGLCAKVTVKPVSVYDGQIAISKTTKEEADSSKSALHMNLRVYEPLRNNILGFVNENNDEIFVAPLGSFTWNTIGGPYSWNIPSIGDLEVSINGIKLDPSKSNKADYLYPTITCPGTQKSQKTYTLKYSNPQSQYLLRPVSQTQQITLQCRVPQLLKIGLPKKHTQQTKTEHDNTYEYVLSQQKNSTVYILAGNCFKISVEGVYGDSRTGVREFYNASNLDIEFKGNLYGKVEQIAADTARNPHSWNTRTIKYDPRARKNSQKYLPDTLTITTRQLLSSKNPPFRLPSALTHQITIQTLEALSILSAPSQIILPAHHESRYTLKLENITDSSRFSFFCDQNVIKCKREGRDSIVITPQNLGKSTSGTITIVDEFALGNPTIVVPVKVQVIDGIDLRVTRNTKKHWGSNIEKEKSSLPIDAWIFDGQQFTAYIDVYSYNSTAANRSPKQPIKNLNPNIIEFNFPSFQSHKIVEISRQYNPTLELVTIVYSLPRTSKNEPRDSSFKFTATIRPLNAKSLVSNTASLRVYNSIALLGTSINLPVEQLSIANKGRTLVREVQSYAHIMQSCSTILEVQGGPPELLTKLILTNGQGHYYNVIKINERRYRIQTIQPTSNKDNKALSDTNFEISGNENNLLSLQVTTQSGQQLAVIKCLIFVSAIKSFHIEGNSMLLAGKHVRYLAQFTESETNNNHIQILKNQCSLKYKWSLDTNSLLITSDPTKIGVNVTGLPAGGTTELTVTILTMLNQRSREVGRASKKVSVVNHDDVHINGVTIGSDEILLLPPYSGVNLGDVVVQEVSPCDRDNSQVNIVGNSQIVTRSSSQNPELLKLQQKSHHNTNLPQYLNIQVAEICTASLQNIDGSINVSPSATGNYVNEGQLIRFYIMDCYGRKFKYYDFKDVEYKIYVNDPNIGTARLANRQQGLVSIQGHEIGQSQVVLEVISRGTVKARDVVPIAVNVFIHPSRPLSLHVGDIVNFKAPQTLSAVEKWSSDNSNIIKINSKSGQAVAYSEGETYVKLGAMSTRLSVVKLIDIVQKRQNNQNSGYEYELVYQGKVYPTNQQDSQFVNKLLHFKCEVLGKQGQFLRGSVEAVIKRDQKQFIKCIVQKIPGTATLQTPIKHLKFRIIAENQNTGFYLQKQFQENLEIFMILSERHINPKDPKFKKDKNSYLLVIQTTERLDFHQTGGKDSWITNSQFNGARQIITLDLSHYRNGEWVIHLQNPRTRQSDSITISSTSHDIHNQQKTISQQGNSGWWNWTDILVLFMAVNFLAILGYQILQRKSGGSTHAKIY